MLTRAAATPLDPEAIFASLEGARGLLLAVSGGPDSMALLGLADRWRKGCATKMAVATVDHGLRSGSRAEAEAVGEIARARAFDHAILTWTGDKPEAGRPAAARGARYRLLADHAAALGADTIVTAHHADDQAETALMRLLRGSGPAGLAGMAALGPVPGREASGLRLARPLLPFAKGDLIAFCRAQGIAFFDDPTNADETYRRPQIRRLAALLAAEGFGREQILRLAARAARSEQALATLVAEKLAALPARRAPGLFEAAATDVARLPEEALVRLLTAEIAGIGSGPAPRLDRLETLVRRLRAGAPVAATLGGVCVRLDAHKLVLKPEAPRRTGP